MPEKLSITAQIPAKKDAEGKVISQGLGPATIVVETGKTAEEMIKLFGDEAVATNANANWVVTIQGNVRARLKKGENQDQIQAGLGGAKMGVAQKGAKVDPIQAYLATFQSATPAEQQKMMADLQKRAAKA